MAFDDMTAFGAIRALAKAGLRVPENCSVVGFDDVAACSLYTPPLTTVRQPMEAMGAMAANLVVEGINAVLEKREVSAVHRKMAPELAVRESTRKLVLNLRKTSRCVPLNRKPIVNIFPLFFLTLAVELPQYSRY